MKFNAYLSMNSEISFKLLRLGILLVTNLLTALDTPTGTALME